MPAVSQRSQTRRKQCSKEAWDCDICMQRLTAAVRQYRDYNEFASSVSEESNKMKAVQKEAVAKQVKLDEESLQRLKEAETKDKVCHCMRGGWLVGWFSPVPAFALALAR